MSTMPLSLLLKLRPPLPACFKSHWKFSLRCPRLLLVFMRTKAGIRASACAVVKQNAHGGQPRSGHGH